MNNARTIDFESNGTSKTSEAAAETFKIYWKKMIFKINLLKDH